MNIEIALLKKPQIKIKLEMKTRKMADKNLRDKPHQQIIKMEEGILNVEDNVEEIDRSAKIIITMVMMMMNLKRSWHRTSRKSGKL